MRPSTDDARRTAHGDTGPDDIGDAGPDDIGDAALAPVLDEAVARTLEHAAGVDRCDEDVRPGLAALGDAGLLSLGARGYDGSLHDQAVVLRRLAGVCMATAFAAWAQRMAVEYVASWGSDELRAEVLPELTTGSRPGATAMATAFQDALGLREVSVTAREDGEDVVLDGMIPWASNLFEEGALVVLPARTEEGRRLIVAIRTDLEGVGLPDHPDLLALGATASTSIRLHEVRIPRSWVLTDRFLDFLTDVRGPFLLLQTAFCLGLADAALDSAEGRFSGPAVVLEEDHRRLEATRAALSAEHARLLAAPRTTGDDVVALRLAAGTLGVDAARHESNVRGGAGYLASSPTARRLREAAFLPIQSPTEAQLRWELSRSA